LDLRNIKARPSDGPLRRDDKSRHRLRKGSGVRVAYRLYSYRRCNLLLWINRWVNEQPKFFPVSIINASLQNLTMGFLSQQSDYHHNSCRQILFANVGIL
jgi:hypothetical protein